MMTYHSCLAQPNYILHIGCMIPKVSEIARVGSGWPVNEDMISRANKIGIN
jgi:hypothetical protein